MKNLLKQKLINNILKTLKRKNEKELSKVKRKNYEYWDSLCHLKIIFMIEKDSKKKIKIEKLNKIRTGSELLKIINENFR